MVQGQLEFESDAVARHSATAQESRILAALQSGRRLTAMDALNEFGSFRLGARIFQLKAEGYNIISERKKLANGKVVAEYHLETS